MMEDVMTMNAQNGRGAFDFVAMIKEDISDEEHDVEKYMDLAEYAEKYYPCHGFDGILRDIAKEERQHNRHLKEILESLEHA